MRRFAVALAALVIGCAPDETTRPLSGEPVLARGGGIGTASHFVATPIIDLGCGTYQGFAGGLYETCSNTAPADHHAAAVEAATSLTPIDGKITGVVLGMSNTSNTACGRNGQQPPCATRTLISKLPADPVSPALLVVNCADAGHDSPSYTSASASIYGTCDNRIAGQGGTLGSVQFALIENTRAGCSVALPSTNACAYGIMSDFAMSLRALRVRYPNIQLALFSTRNNAPGHGSSHNPEPYAYETGWAVKFLIQCQVDQRRGLPSHPQCGDLMTVAPVAVWLSYPWARLDAPNGQGTQWIWGGKQSSTDDYWPDGQHPETAVDDRGVDVVSDLWRGRNRAGQVTPGFGLLESPYTRCWVLAAAPMCE